MGTRTLSTAAGLLTVLLCAAMAPAAPELSKLFATRSPSRSANVVFVAEGYTAAQRPDFDYIVSRTFSAALNTVPFKQYARFMNFYSVWAASRQTGISSDDATVDNYWGGRTCGICTCLGRRDSLVSFLDHTLPEWTVAIVIYRDDAKRGLHTCAGRVTLTPDRIVERGAFIESEQVHVILHEFGHVLGGLSDEHELLSGGGAGKRAAARYPAVQVRNTVSGTVSRETLPWKSWVSPTVPIPTPDTGVFKDSLGAFLAHTAGFYRPRLQCRMRSIYTEFCEVCREGMILSFYQHCGPIDSFSQPSGSVHTGVPAVLKAVPVMSNAPLAITWSVDGTPLSNARGLTLDMSAIPLTPGTHRVAFAAEDTTSTVRMYRGHELLKSRAEWTVNVAPSAISRNLKTSLCIASIDMRRPVVLLDGTMVGGLRDISAAWRRRAGGAGIVVAPSGKRAKLLLR